MTEEKISYGDKQAESTPKLIRDGREDMPIFVHSELDDMEMTLEAFRVYCHLARRAGKNGLAFPSYQSIGEKCFRKQYPKASTETLRRKAIAAVKELVDLGLVLKQAKVKSDGSMGTNDYMLTPRSQWGGSVNTLGVVSTHQGSVNAPQGVNTLHSVNAPKGSPIEDNPIKGSPIEESFAADAEQPPKAGRKDSAHNKKTPGAEGQLEIFPDTTPLSPPPRRPPSEWQQFVGYLSVICHGHDKLDELQERQEKALLHEAKTIKDNGYTIDHLRVWYDTIWKADWRSRNSKPSPAEVRSSIASVKTEGREDAHGQAGYNPGWTQEETEHLRKLRMEGRRDEAGEFVRNKNRGMPPVS